MSGAMNGSYPPPPWRLAGTAHLGLWPLPAAALPWALVPGTRPFTLLGRTFVAVAFVAYRGGDLDYDELAVMVPVGIGRRLAVTIVRIWVDSPASLEGGRALWGIPKEMAAFRGTEAADAAGPFARLRVGTGLRLPGRWPARATVAQARDGTPALTHASLRARIALVRGAWDFAPAGPLGVLAGRRPWATVRLAPLAMRFGV